MGHLFVVGVVVYNFLCILVLQVDHLFVVGVDVCNVLARLFTTLYIF